jgi:hypothetical protein
MSSHKECNLQFWQRLAGAGGETKKRGKKERETRGVKGKERRDRYGDKNEDGQNAGEGECGWRKRSRKNDDPENSKSKGAVRK